MVLVERFGWLTDCLGVFVISAGMNISSSNKKKL